ncbi:hypothetical protein DUNSADRAFT_3130 [Dunaliella salina]|uniref:Uncharacterized protein n=1 Tax=Dunaliella salina TaxID=3046 RepID=A0ABQ7H824_DUNSA|nr:hypothetical protein DUNSADRAFT_3130 [Dunaliella salina]|eukprot:KAF5843001.1 hypothetical protein DUNSADRAFT_3130 [Dunaliella salina]
MSAHKGSLIPNASGQVSAAQVQHSIQLKQQHEQQQALMRALSAANYHNAMEKAEAMRRSHRSPKSGSSSMRASQHQDTVGNSDEKRSEEASRNDKDGSEAGEEECQVSTPPTPDYGSAVSAPESRGGQEVAHGKDVKGEAEEGQ